MAEPIENHGVIGDLRTVALVGMDGCIDFLCAPRFDSPTVFARLLDEHRGGCFILTPVEESERRRQLYLPETNVLLTRFLSSTGVGEIMDFMAVPSGTGPQRILRQVHAVRGDVRFRMRCSPRFDYARAPHRLELDGRVALFRSEHLDLRLIGPEPLARDGDDAVLEFTVRQGEATGFVLEFPPDGPPCDPVTACEDLLRATSDWWRAWIRRCHYEGRWMEEVHRSALALRLLFDDKHGSIVAAPTFGLPERPGGIRNWDYRFTWVRDAAYTVYTLTRLGFHEETERFVGWLASRSPRPGGAPLQPMYRLDGSLEAHEIELPHLSGYADSRPVRVGNAAVDQLQLDIYGEVIDALFLYDRDYHPLSTDVWAEVVELADWVCANWQQPDSGMWEVRGPRRQFLHSKVMCWVALDRAWRIAHTGSRPAPRDRWLATRDAIHRHVMQTFWRPEAGCFAQHEDTSLTDASSLMMPMARFISATDPRWLSHLRAIERELVTDSLVFRYSDSQEDIDGLPGTEGTFTTCSFWWVENLALSGQVEKARVAFEKMSTFASHVGLWSEELGPCGEHLGNFPQALTHLALISAALALDGAVERQQGWWRPRRSS